MRARPRHPLSACDPPFHAASGRCRSDVPPLVAFASPPAPPWVAGSYEGADGGNSI